MMAGQLLAVHDFLQRQGRRHHNRLAGVVPLAMARRARHEFLSRHDARRLVGCREAVDVGPQGDDRPAPSVAANP
jgi:hypothetical protein